MRNTSAFCADRRGGWLRGFWTGLSLGRASYDSAKLQSRDERVSSKVLRWNHTMNDNNDSLGLQTTSVAFGGADSTLSHNDAQAIAAALLERRRN